MLLYSIEVIEMTEPKHGRGYVYDLKYHLVWCVKYRKKILVGPFEKDFKDIIRELCETHEIELLEMETDQDHVHLLISCKPQHYIPDFVKTLKGQSARRLFKIHPTLKEQLWGGHLWNPSYFITSVSENTQAQVENYIRSQKEK